MSGSKCPVPCLVHTDFSGGRSDGMVFIPISFRIYQFVVIHTVKGFSLVNETKVDGFLEFLSFLCDPGSVGNLISGFSAFSKPSLYIWKFSFHILLKPSLKEFENNLTSM